jgi:transcriptional regulator with XRE-family HTH domain
MTRRQDPNPGGRKLRAAREARGLSQQDLAELVGCDDSTITGWESQRDRRRKPDLSYAFKLKEVLDLNPKVWL